MSAAPRLSKQPRETPVTIDDLLEEARIIWRRDRAQAEDVEDRNFRECFGCSPSSAMIVWDLLVEYDLLPEDGTHTHYMWTLMWMKVYARNKVMATLCGGIDVKTMMKWVMKFIYAMAYLEPFVIVWDNRYQGDRQADCLVSLDCTDVKCRNWGPAFSTYKHGKKGGLRYEIAHCIQTGHIVWVNGPFPAGRFNDITIFRGCMLSHLDDGERVEADDGYIGEAPRYVKCPKSFANPKTTKYMQSRVRSREETINKRVKDFNVLQTIYRHEPEDHGWVFRACLIVKQISIINGEPLFDCGYKDPPFDDDGNDEYGSDDPE